MMGRTSIGVVAISLAVATATGGCGNDSGQGSQTDLTQPSTQTTGPDMSHLEAVALTSWPDFEEESSRSLGESDLRYYAGEEGVLTGGYERVFTDGPSELRVTLVELDEGTEAGAFLASMVDAWRSNPNLIGSDEVEVPNLPDARGLRFESAVDYVRVFGAGDGVAIDVSVRAQSSGIDALGLAAEALEAQLELVE